MITRARLVDAGYAAGWRVVRALPERVAQGLFRVGADRARSPQLRANLARLAPGADLDALVRAGMRSYARYWCEVFRLPSMDLADVHRRMDPHVRGAQPFLDAQRHGRGVVFALTHSGNWDVAGVWLVETLRALGREPSFTTVAAKLEPESLYRRFVAYRESLGFEVVAAEDGAYRALTRRLRAGGVVCLVSDLDLSRSGVDVELCGEPARIPGGAARLAATTGALLLPAVPSFTPDGWALDIAAPVPVPDRAAVAKATQGVADALGALLTRVPQDWHMLQPIWTADRA